MRYADRKNGAFTLVELLVVISIIALLLAILMPALQRARASAYRVTCGSQMHQQFIGVMAYAGDYRGRLPFGSANSSYALSCCLNTNTGEGYGWPVLLPYMSKNGTQSGVQKYNQIASDTLGKKFFFCPANPPIKQADINGNNYWTWCQYIAPGGMGYFTSGYLMYCGRVVSVDPASANYLKSDGGFANSPQTTSDSGRFLVANEAALFWQPGARSLYTPSYFINHKTKGVPDGANALYLAGNVTWNRYNKSSVNSGLYPLIHDSGTDFVYLVAEPRNLDNYNRGCIAKAKWGAWPVNK